MKAGVVAIRMGVLAVAVVSLGACATLFGGGAAIPAVGTWDTTVESQLGTSEQVLVINDDLTGSVSTGDAELAISNVVAEGDTLNFDITFDIQGSPLEAKFSGTIDGDSITGEYVTDLGNGELTGTRQ